MADIHYMQEHKLSHKKAKAAAQKVADELAAEYDLTCIWQGDILHFERSGAKGSLVVSKTEAIIRIKLGFVLSVFSRKIEDQVTKNMKKVFTGKE
jgi:putative polyhydroxyalkanoate system protein